MAQGECQVGDLYYLDSHNEPCMIRQEIKRSGMLERSFVDKQEQISHQMGAEVFRSSKRLEESEPYLSQGTMPGINCDRSQIITMSRDRIPVRGNALRAAKGRFKETSRLTDCSLLLYWGGMAGKR